VVEAERRLLGLVAIGNQASEQVDEEVEWTAVTRVLDLADILELIDDGLDEGALAQEQLVGVGQDDVAPVLAQLGDEPEALREEELLSEGRGDVALVRKEFAKEPMDQARNWSSAVEIAWGETESEQLATVIDDQMQLEVVEPPHRGLAASRIDAKDTALLDTGGMADRQRGRVDEADARALSALDVQVDGQGHEEARHEIDKAGIGHQLRKLVAQMDLDVLEVEPLEGAIPRLLEEDEDGEDLGRMEPGRASPTALA